MSKFKISSLLAELTDVEELAVPLPAPFATFSPYQKIVITGDLGARGLGYPSATWTWGFLSNAQRDQLRTFCTGPSSTVYIQTISNENSTEVKTFIGTMVWPEKEEPQSQGRRLEFVLAFLKLIEVEEE